MQQQRWAQRPNSDRANGPRKVSARSFTFPSSGAMGDFSSPVVHLENPMLKGGDGETAEGAATYLPQGL